MTASTRTTLLLHRLASRRSSSSLLSIRLFSSSSPSLVAASTSSSPSPKFAASDVAADDLLLDDDDDAAAAEGLIRSSSTAAAMATVPSLLQPRVVVYDGVCHLCHRGVKLVIQADKHKKIKFCCLQSKAAEPYMRVAGLDREDVLRRFLFIEGPSLYHQGSTAALRVLSYLPLPYSALSSLLVVPTPWRDAAYDYVAKRRYNWFGKDNACLVLQDKELLERFIDRDEMMDDNSQHHL